MASILTASLAFCPAFFLPYVLICVLACYLAFYLAFYLTFFSGVLSGISSEILCGRGLAGNTLIWSLRWRSGWEHSDPEVAVRVRQGHCDLALADSPSSVVFSMVKTKNHLEIPYLEQTQVQISEITQQIQTMIPTYSTMARDSPWSL